MLSARREARPPDFFFSNSDKCFACSMDDYLEKPILRDRLEMMLHRWFNGEQRAAS